MKWERESSRERGQLSGLAVEQRCNGSGESRSKELQARRSGRRMGGGKGCGGCWQLRHKPACGD